MRQFKLTAVVLGAVKIGDSDKLVRIFSKEKGKLSVKAKGVRKIKSKLKGQLDSLNLISLEITKGKTDLDIITGVQAINSFKNIKSDLKKISLAYFFVEFLDKTIVEGQRNLELFNLLENVFEFLDSGGEDLELIKLIFIAKTLSILGHKPLINKCVICHDKIKDTNILGFDIEHGGTICGNCRNGEPTVDFEILKILNAVEKLEVKSSFSLNVEKNTVLQSLALIEAFSSHVFEREFRSNKFLKHINNL